MLGSLGACPVTILFFLLPNFDSTSAIFKTLCLALNKINCYSFLGGVGEGGGDNPGLPSLK